MADEHARPFIGKQLRVVSSTNTSYEGCKGLIIDETKNTFVIQTSQEQKTILKKGCIFDIDGKQIQSTKIMKRLEDRIKSRR